MRDLAIRHYREATAAERRAGKAWYSEAERVSRELSERSPAGVGPVRMAGVIAALSPRAQWVVNVRWASQLVMPGASRAVGLPDARDKAQRILAGEWPGDVLRGPKVRSFWRAISGDTDAAVLDVWMARALELPYPLSHADYRRGAAALREAARELSVSTRELQATIWLHVRGTKPLDPEPFRV